MNKRQIIGVIIFFFSLAMVLIPVGYGIIALFTALGLFSEILIAGIMAFGFIFLVFILAPVGLLALFLRGWVWTAKQTVLTAHDLSDWLGRKEQSKSE